MYMQGKKINKLSQMSRGHIYMYVCDSESTFSLQYGDQISDITDEADNVLFTFVFVDSAEGDSETIYFCNPLELESEHEMNVLSDSIEQYEIDEGRAALYKLGEV